LDGSNVGASDSAFSKPPASVEGRAQEVNYREIAEKYCREQLTVMDGSFEAALRRIGTERFEKMIQDVEKALPKYAPPKDRP
jgi:hypothetical protein